MHYREERSSRRILGCVTAAKPPCTATTTTYIQPPDYVVYFLPSTSANTLLALMVVIATCAGGVFPQSTSAFTYAHIATCTVCWWCWRLWSYFLCGGIYIYTSGAIFPMLAQVVYIAYTLLCRWYMKHIHHFVKWPIFLVVSEWTQLAHGHNCKACKGPCASWMLLLHPSPMWYWVFLTLSAISVLIELVTNYVIMSTWCLRMKWHLCKVCYSCYCCCVSYYFNHCCLLLMESSVR